MKPIHFGMLLVPLFFILLMAIVTYASFHRKSGVTGLDAAKIQKVRFFKSEQKA
ncbi:MAG: hypothetical protein K940chlam3_00470 [Chlamydiae bacterium]|nr:hypothetical protein [Chlamydiota bacterium]